MDNTETEISSLLELTLLTLPTVDIALRHRAHQNPLLLRHVSCHIRQNASRVSAHWDKRTEHHSSISALTLRTQTRI
jgi:hypothetical protein